MIKPLKQTDYTVAKRLFQDTFDLTEDPNFITAWAHRDEQASLGYWDDDVLVGAAIVGDGKLHYIYTHDAYRGSGLGTRLLKAVIARCPTIHLTPVDEPGVQQWYVKHGFHLSRQEGAYRMYARHTHDLRNHRSNH